MNDVIWVVMPRAQAAHLVVVPARGTQRVALCGYDPTRNRHETWLPWTGDRGHCSRCERRAAESPVDNLTGDQLASYLSPIDEEQT
jgi:hypothetical protein